MIVGVNLIVYGLPTSCGPLLRTSTTTNVGYNHITAWHCGEFIHRVASFYWATLVLGISFGILLSLMLQMYVPHTMLYLSSLLLMPLGTKLYMDNHSINPTLIEGGGTISFTPWRGGFEVFSNLDFQPFPYYGTSNIGYFMCKHAGTG